MRDADVRKAVAAMLAQEAKSAAASDDTDAADSFDPDAVARAARRR